MQGVSWRRATKAHELHTPYGSTNKQQAAARVDQYRFLIFVTEQLIELLLPGIVPYAIGFGWGIILGSWLVAPSTWSF